MQHLLLTRYNILLNAAKKEGVDSLSHDWLSHRDRIFRRYCVASVQAQTSKNFRWVVLFHPETPQRYFFFLKGIATVIHARTTKEGLAIARRDILAGSPVMASRVDNDDMLATNFIEEVQRAASEEIEAGARQDFAVIAPRGAFIDLPSARWKPAHYPQGPFTTIVEFVSAEKPWLSPLGVQHFKTVKKYPVKYVESGAPMWAQISHERNLGNRFHWEKPGAPPEPFSSLPASLSAVRAFPRTLHNFFSFLRGRPMKTRF